MANRAKEMERTGDRSRSGPMQQETAHGADAPPPRQSHEEPGGSNFSGHQGDSHVGGSHLRGATSHLNSMGHGHGNSHPHHTRKPSHHPDHHTMTEHGPRGHRVKR